MVQSAAARLSSQDLCQKMQILQEKINQQIVGQEHLVEEALCALLAGGHILMTGAPGLAKTTLVRVFASHLSLDFGRIQFTPDLLPSDILGSEILHMDQESGRRYFEFQSGPVFANLILADEINRASPRTQSALLEAMQERTVTYGGKKHELPSPFLVFATQNPFESEGTFPLPEAQLDRFLLHTLVDYPDSDSEKNILNMHAKAKLVGENEIASSGQVVTTTELGQVIDFVKEVNISSGLVDAINRLVRSSRPSDPSCPEEFRDRIWYGAGPRAGLSLVSITKALAFLKGEPEVLWDHIKRVAKPVLRHRIRLVGMSEGGVDSVIERLLDLVEKNTENRAKGLS